MRELIIDNKYMAAALDEARLAYGEGEVPVGAVVVLDDEIISSAHNRVEALRDASAHAELLAMRAAAERVGSWRLNECVLYVTLEPCAMCVGAAMNFRIGALAFGAFDAAAGCCISRCELSNGVTNISLPYVGGIMEAECSGILKRFFEKKRR